MNILAIDAGTTGIRALLISENGEVVTSAYEEFRQHFPKPGWIEHDLEEIWATVTSVIKRVFETSDRITVGAIGITNQRETACAWSRSTGKPRSKAIVWQDRRTAERCDELRDIGHEALIRSKTGLVLDPYFSATKFEWLLKYGKIDPDADLALGTVDSWILFKLTGHRVHATDWSNASRTMLFDLDSLTWSEDLCELFSIPGAALPELFPSSHEFGRSDPEFALGLNVPIAGIAGDQQASLFGQACFEPGMSKNTYGTGSFVLMCTGQIKPPTVNGLLTTLAWGIQEKPTFAYEGAIFSTGSALQWLRDGLGIIEDASEAGSLAEGIEDTGGVYLVPAFSGLGSPWWDPYARAALVGLTRGTGKAEIVRAAVEAMAYQTRDVIEAMQSSASLEVSELRVDGGASVMDFLCQFQADQLGLKVRRALIKETTALGAAYLAGLTIGLWGSPSAIADRWQQECEFDPAGDREHTELLYQKWRDAVIRCKGWASG